MTRITDPEILKHFNAQQSDEQTGAVTDPQILSQFNDSPKDEYFLQKS